MKFMTVLFTTLALPSSTFAAHITQEQNQQDFNEHYHQESWREVFFEPGYIDWYQQWFLDGKKSVIKNDMDKMTIDTMKDCYAVLWTKDSFNGNLKIEYDFLRADDNPNGVNILYIQATGHERKGYGKDISKWSKKRTNAYMSDYYAHMHTYHLSYAASKEDYIRGRRYLPDQWLPDKAKLWGTAIKGESKHVGIFGDKQWVHVTVIKYVKELYVQFQHPNKTVYLHLKNTDKPAIEEDRIGLRLMPKRISYFKNFRVSVTN